MSGIRMKRLTSILASALLVFSIWGNAALADRYYEYCPICGTSCNNLWCRNQSNDMHTWAVCSNFPCLYYIPRYESHTKELYSETAATCTAGGTKTYHCYDCDTYFLEASEPLGHSFTNYISNDDATCVMDGTKTATCDRCAETDTMTDAGTALGHSFTNYTSNNDATCTTDGTKTATCDRCDVTDTVPDPGSAKGHQYNGTVNAPTCTKEGYTTYRCSGCGNSYTADKTRALGHWYGLWTPNGNGTHSADCRRDGCMHTSLADCEPIEVTIDGNVMPCCFICGMLGDQHLLACEFDEVAEIDLGAIPERGELIVRGIEAPVDGALYALTAAYEYGGKIEPFMGSVTISVPLVLAKGFMLVRVNVTEATDTAERTDVWTEIPFTYEEGILAFETDTAGLFLMLPI